MKGKPLGPEKSRSPNLPPIKLERPLMDVLTKIAEKEGRTLSDVARCAIRDGLAIRKGKA